MPDDYAPFPEAELMMLAQYHDDRAEMLNLYAAGFERERAKICRDAIAGHEALRTRFLEQSMLVRALQSEHAA
jgi:hypothetical protein